MDNQDQIIIPTPIKNVAPVKDVAPIDGEATPRYTTISGANCDCRTVKILKALLGGRAGEFTGVSTYFFQHLITNGTNNALSNSLKQISLDEMKHMELLGSAIIAFGGTPRFTNGQGTPWSSRFVNYQTSQQDFLKNNIRAEEQAILNYERAIALVTNESLKQLFRDIIADERRHIQIFQGYLNN